jgi:hypothetical protein
MAKEHWLQRKRTIRRLWMLFYVILFATVFAEVLIARKPLGTLDAILGFNALYGFLTCVAMVGFAKALGFVLKRRDDYYDA